MARVNPQVEHLQRMNDAYKRTIQRLLQDPGDVPLYACDHSCVVATATGMAPNGGCRCDERKLRTAVRYWRGRAQFLQATIQMMRGDEMLAELAAAALKESEDRR